MRNLIRSALAAVLALQPVLAAAQSAPANLPYHTVYGRLGAVPGDVGPGQAIPFATLVAQIGGVNTTRRINTTAPLSGGGDLSADRTLSINALGIDTTLIAANAVTFAKFQQMAALSMLGNCTNATANTAAVTGTANQVLRVNGAGTSCGFGAIDLSQAAAAGGVLQAASAPAFAGGDVTSSAGSLNLAIGTNKVTRGMQAQGIARSVIGVIGNATANVADIQGTANQWFGIDSAGTSLAFRTLAGDCTGPITAINCTKTNTVAFTAGATAAAGQLPGEPTTGSASAGNVGEFISSNVVIGSAVVLSTGTPINITSISLTAGDWDVTGGVFFNPGATTSITRYGGDVTLTTTSSPSVPGASYIVTQAAFVPGNGNTIGFGVGPLRVSISSTTSVFLTCVAVFTVSTLGGYGLIRARRVR